MSSFGSRGSPDAKPSGGKEISLSVEETNRLRLKLGLKPLRPTVRANASATPAGSSSVPIHAPAPSRSDATSQSQRNRDSKPPLVPSVAAAAVLGLDEEQEEEDEEDTAAWVERMRRDTSKETNRKKRPRTGAPIDSIEVGSEKESFSASGVRIKHSALHSMPVDDQAVLTLADTQVLDESGNALNEDDDVLVDIGEREDAKTRQAVRLRSGAAVRDLEYDPTDDAEFGAVAGSDARRVLMKYDNQEEQVVHRIEIDGTLGDTAVSDQQKVGERLRAAQAEFAQENTKVGTTFESDFYTMDEYVAKFKKKVSGKSTKKRKGDKKTRASKKRKRENRVFDDGDRDEQSAVADVGKNGRDANISEDEEERIASLKVLREAAASKQGHPDPQEEDPEGDAELQESLARARRLANQSREAKAASSGVNSLLEAVQSRNRTGSVEDGAVLGGADPTEVPVILTEAEQFVRTIGPSSVDVYGAEDLQKEDLKDSERSGDLQGPDTHLEKGSGCSDVGTVERVTDGGRQPPTPGPGHNPLALDGFEEGENAATKPMGLAHTLARLRTLGQLNQRREQSGRVRDERVDWTLPTGGREVKLTYKDDQGRDLTPKEAFRIMSHKFHGKQPGQNKREAQMRRQLRSMELRQNAVAEDTRLASVAALVQETKKIQSAHVVLSGAAAIPQGGFLGGGAEGPLDVSKYDGDRHSGMMGRRPDEIAHDAAEGKSDAEPLSSVGEQTAAADKVEFSLGSGTGNSTKRSRRL